MSEFMKADTEHETRARYVRVLRRAMEDADVSAPALTRHLGRKSKTTVQKWLNPDDRSQMRLHDLARAPSDVARSIIGALAHDHGLDVWDATSVESLDHEAHLALLMKELNGAFQHYNHVLRTEDGHITNSELISLDKEVREARDALTLLASWVRKEKGARGVI